MTIMQLQLNPTFVQTTVALTLSGTKATDRKMSALSQADDVGIVAISHGSGTVAKEARAMKAEAERDAVAENIGRGNFHAFAVAWAARTGETVKFGLKDHTGAVVRKASDDFRKFSSVIEHKIANLEDKGKIYNAKGNYTSAAADLMYMLSLHERAIKVMDAIAAADAARRAKLAEEQATLLAMEQLAESGELTTAE